jgi:hypothetical protein
MAKKMKTEITEEGDQEQLVKDQKDILKRMVLNLSPEEMEVIYNVEKKLTPFELAKKAISLSKSIKFPVTAKVKWTLHTTRLNVLPSDKLENAIDRYIKQIVKKYSPKKIEKVYLSEDFCTPFLVFAEALTCISKRLGKKINAEFKHVVFPITPRDSRTDLIDSWEHSNKKNKN